MARPKQPPHDLEAEASVIGGIMNHPDRLTIAEETLRTEDFYSQANQTIYQNIIAMSLEGDPIDLLSVKNRLENADVLDKVGGAGYLAEIYDKSPMSDSYRKHCEIVRDRAMLRRLVDAATGIIDDCYGEFESINDVVERAEQKIFHVAEGQIQGDFQLAEDIVPETIQYIDSIYKNKGKLIGLSTGFRELDDRTSGLQKSDLIYIAARPSMGKTAFALNIAQHAAVRENAAVAIFSLEMSRLQLMQRMLCSEGLIDLSKVRKGELDVEDWEVLGDAAERITTKKIYIDDTAGQTIADIRAKSRRLKAERGLDLLVIDYLQLMTGSRRAENRQNEISEISRGLKALARELDCPIVCLSQLSRAPDGRPDHHPMLADLRESGSIEQDADIVMFLYREYYYDKENGNPNMAELDIAKQRNGPTGKINLTWRPEFVRFMDWADDKQYPDPAPGLDTPF